MFWIWFGYLLMTYLLINGEVLSFMTNVLWEDYGFVVRGKQRREIIKLMDRPKTPTELKEESKLSITNVSRVLIQFEKQGLAKCITPQHVIGRVYRLTKRGEEVRNKLTKKED